jgi:hypothetical protein
MTIAAMEEQARGKNKQGGRTSKGEEQARGKNKQGQKV